MAVLLAALGAAAACPAAAADDFEDIATITAHVNRALETQRTGVPSRWSSPATGHGGTIIVTKTYYRSDGVPCRDYSRTTEKDGQTKLRVHGTGCRAGAGTWTLNEDKPLPPPKSAEPESEPAAPSAPPRVAAPPPVPRDTAAKAPDATAEPEKTERSPAPSERDLPPPPSASKPAEIVATLPARSED